MPHINRIRVNNVKYNFGTQFYDDFQMRFSCKNTIYDLANGGGKSVLMLLLFQNLIPNCTLDDKQPIEKLFRTNEGSSTIHSMIEWNLSDAHIQNSYKYMLTGFCARKARDYSNGLEEENKNSTPIEYFNYCIFYKKYNDNDIKNFPLSSNGERITYSGLKNYLKELDINNMNLEVKVFEKKGDYQRFIADYGLYESEWEIIRGINKTEGHVRTYFESNYRTTRKVVEDLLIEEIIEKSFRNRYSAQGEEDELAKTLLAIKDKLLELSKKKEEINNYDRQIEIINSFIERLNSLKVLYSGIDNAFTNLKKSYNSVLMAQKENKDNIEKSADNRLDLLKNKDDLMQKVDTAKVISDMKDLDNLTTLLDNAENEISKISNSINELIEKQRNFQAINYYIEYLEYKKEYDKLKQVIDNTRKDNSALLSQMKELVIIKKERNEVIESELKSKYEREFEISLIETENIEKQGLENREIDNTIAVHKFRIKELSDNLANYNQELLEAKNQTSLLLVTDVDSVINKNNRRIDELKLKNNEIEENITEYNKNKLSLLVNIKIAQAKKEDLEAKLTQLQINTDKINRNNQKLKKLHEVYGEVDNKLLIEKVKNTYREMVKSYAESESELEEKLTYINELKDRKMVGESKELNRVIEYINRYHSDSAISGPDYLNMLNYKEREELVKKAPILAYGIVIKNNYDQIIFDSKLDEIIDSNYPVILINEEYIDENINDIYFDEKCHLVKKKNFYYSEEKCIELFNKNKSEYDQSLISLKRRNESIEVVQEDYEFLVSLNIEDNSTSETQYNELKLKYDEVNQFCINQTQELECNEENIACLSEKKNANSDELTAIEREQNNLLRVKDILVKYRECEKHLNIENDKVNALENDYETALKRMDATKNMADNRRKLLANLKTNIENIEIEWNTKYSKYYDVGCSKLSSSDYNALSNEELDVKLEALLENLKQENSEVADKERLISNYKVSMDRAVAQIKYYDADIDQLSNEYLNNNLNRIDDDELSNIKREIEKGRMSESSARDKAQQLRSKKDKLQGQITHSISIISEKYGYFEADSIKSEEIDTYLNENGAILEDITEKIEIENNNLKLFEEESVTLRLLRKDIENLMAKSKINQDASVGVFDSIEKLEANCKNVNEEIEKFVDEKYKRNQEFEHDLSMLIETLNKLNAFELSTEIRNSIMLPSNESETIDIINTLTETTKYIELEKQRVIRGLEDIQTIKDNFENQCIQSCINIKTELERLSKLSRITMDDQTISIINLKIPYIKEEFYKDKMASYIDNIAVMTDQFDQMADKLRFIRNSLCWKKLFSVIVTDMNSIKLNLYKRERISSQSRYLPYEEAVGSTGQSQGIYIQFLIAIINYISSINSKNSDASKLKKVIFIDNPFGAAKDIYIWEPIFKLLKANNVQLVVPARGATPAITGRFDVNYVLGQKLIEGKQQTVVVDYFSNVEKDDLEYTTLLYEQTALF